MIRFAALPALLLLAALAPGCALVPGVDSRPEATVLGAEVVAAPLHGTDSGTFAVDLFIEGTGPHRALLDTGSSLLVLDSSLAASMDFGGAALPMWIRGSAGSEWSSVPRGTLGEIRIEGEDGAAASFLRTGAVVLDGPGVPAVVGLRLFADCLVTLDFPRSRLEIRRGALPEPDGISVFPFSDVDAVPSIGIGVGGRTVTVTLDSGFGGALSLPEAMTEGLRFGEESLATEFQHVHGTGTAVIRRLLDPVRVGSLTAEGIPLFIAEGPPLLGMGILRHLRLTFDHARGRVRIEPFPPPPGE